MQGTLDTIKGEHQSETIKYFYKLFICDIDSVSTKLNKKSFCNILGVDFIFSTLHRFGYGGKIIHLIKVDSHDTPISNLRLK